MPLSSLSLLRHHPPRPLPPTSNRQPPHPRLLHLLLPPFTRRCAFVCQPLAAATDDMAAASASALPSTLLEHMGQAGTAADLTVLVAHIQSACKRIAALVASPGNAELSRSKAGGGTVAAGRDAPKPLDELSVRAVFACSLVPSLVLAFNHHVLFYGCNFVVGLILRAYMAVW